MADISNKIQIPEAFSFLFEPAPYKVAYGGRGGAKSWNFARALLIQGMHNKLRILCAREVQLSIEESVYEILRQQIEQMKFDDFYQVMANRIKGANGTEFIFKGLKKGHVNSVKSMEGIDICWVEEGQSVSEQSWDVLDPTIRKEGAEIWTSFNTGIEEDPVYQRFVVNPPPGAIVRKINYDQNPFFPETLRAKMEHCKNTDQEKYNHIWLGEPSTLKGAYFAELLRNADADGRIARFDYIPTIPMFTAWDLGMDDSNAIWFGQKVGQRYRFLKYMEYNGKALDFYATYVESQPYQIYDQHLLPHDINNRDISAASNSDGTPRTRKQVLESMLRAPVVPVSRVPSQNDGIEATRNMLPFCEFDEEGCKDGLRALRNYHPEYNEKLDKYNDYPAHDWSSHGTKAFETFARGYQDRIQVPKKHNRFVEFVSAHDTAWMGG